MRRARHIAMKGWIVEEKRETGWVRMHQGLTKHEAYWIAYGEEI